MLERLSRMSSVKSTGAEQHSIGGNASNSHAITAHRHARRLTPLSQLAAHAHVTFVVYAHVGRCPSSARQATASAFSAAVAASSMLPYRLL